MFKKGDYFLETTYFNGEESFIVKHIHKRTRHTHIPMNRGYNAARMVLIRAVQGKIPDDYPEWMVTSINRLWFGENFMNRTDLCNENLRTNDPDVRFYRNLYNLKKKKNQKKRRGNKQYYDRHTFIDPLS